MRERGCQSSRCTGRERIDRKQIDSFHRETFGWEWQCFLCERVNTASRFVGSTINLTQFVGCPINPASRFALGNQETKLNQHTQFNAGNLLRYFGGIYVVRPSNAITKGGIYKGGQCSFVYLFALQQSFHFIPDTLGHAASHSFGKCSECGEIICVEKAVTDTQSTRSETTELLYKAFRLHVRLNHSADFSDAAAPI